MRSPGRAPPRHIPMVPAGPARSAKEVSPQPVRLSIMAAALLFVSSPCPLVRATCMHPPYT